MKKYLLYWLAIAMAPGSWVLAQEATKLPEVTVIGSKDNVARLPGSGEFLDRGDIRTQNYDDVAKVLRKVPGVYIREEDGNGLFPNISLRGVAVGRSSKVTLMEDGVIAAPAPYSSPAAYYSPNVGRMDGVEVLKGSSQIKYGPHTSGGVINYLSTPIPQQPEAYIKSLFGTDGEIRNHLYYGARHDTDAGRFGYLIEYYDRQTDGFKTIDATPDFTDTDRTGFHKKEPMLKLSWEPNTEKYQSLEFKIGYTDLTAYETYMGITDEDFKNDPYRRYAGSRFDVIDSEQLRTFLRHNIELSTDLRLTTTAYYNEFTRNWFKENSTGADLGNPARLAVLKGEAAGELIYRNNNRDYYSAGVETVLNIKKETGAYTHDIDLGVRYHQDAHERFQRDDIFVQSANGTITDRINGIPGGAGNRKEDATAIALYAQDAIKRGAWTLVPGLRYEHVRNEYRDYDTKGERGKVVGKGDDTLDIFAPGLGALYELNEQASLFGGIYRGFSVPEPRANAKDGIEEETSTGYELGFRYNDRKAFQAELALFYTDFNDLIVPDIAGAGGGGTTENVGDIYTAGVEGKLAYDLGAARNWGFSNPWYLAATWTQAELESDTASREAGSIFAGGKKGAKVPYVPEWQFLVGSGLDFKKWGVFVDVTYVDETFTTASNVSEPVDLSGKANYSYGKTDSYVLVDVSGYRELAPGIKLIASVGNLFDEEYIGSRHPAGPRPGRPMTAMAGLEFSF